MNLLKTQVPLLYVIIKTLWDIITTLSLSMLIFAVVLMIVWMMNRTAAVGG